MFAEPTIDDFLELIDWHIAKALDRAERSVNRVMSEASGKGTLYSGGTVTLIIEAVRTEFEAGVDAAFGELKRVISKTNLDPRELRQHTAQRLTQFATDAKAGVRMTLGLDVQKQLAAFDQYLRFALRQFDVGFLDPSEPEVPAVANNSINIGTMSGGAIQQGSPGATQTVEFKLNVEVALAAVHTFESELSKVRIDDGAVTELAADIATIKAQLSKPSPSIGILQEAGKSIRNIVEGIAGGILTSPVLTAAAELGDCRRRCRRGVQAIAPARGGRWARP
jgi:hypothetical protein